MNIGIWVPCYKKWTDRNSVRALARSAETFGFRSLWVQDHLVAPVNDQPIELLSGWLDPDDYGGDDFTAVEYYGEENWWLDPFALWGFLAAVTEECELGSAVVVMPYRHPVVQAKMLGTLDVLSGGRVLFGVGVGHVPSEFEVLNVPYRERGQLTDEYLRAVAALLSNEEVDFAGESISFDLVRPLIRPIQNPHPPFLIGGNSKRAVRRAVEIGNGWLPAHVEPESLARGIAYLKELSSDRNRETPGVSVSLTWGLVGPEGKKPTESRRRFRGISETVDLIGQYADLGCDRLAIDLPNPSYEVMLEQMELLEQAIAQSGVHS